MNGDDTSLLYLGFSESDRNLYNNNKIHYNQLINGDLKQAQRLAKPDRCYFCGKRVTSFCNSHSIPRFCLSQIASEGKMYTPNLLIDLPIMSKEKGVNQAGTFQLICHNCDNTIFQEYENPNAYELPPNSKMLAEIALKNYLLMISKRLNEAELYKLLAQQYANGESLLSSFQTTTALDLDEYKEDFERSKQGVLKHHEDWYYLFYFQHLDYIVPYAFQSSIALISDLEDNIINDIYMNDPKNKIKDIHLAIFPLQQSSVIVGFIDSRNKKYRKFYRQLKLLPLEQQLATLNYIVFSYSENVFLSKSVPQEIIQNKAFIETCQKTILTLSTSPSGPNIHTAIEHYSLRKRNEIPNLLDRKYELKRPSIM
mgnify:CR=1 FL=1